MRCGQRSAMIPHGLVFGVGGMQGRKPTCYCSHPLTECLSTPHSAMLAYKRRGMFATAQGNCTHNYGRRRQPGEGEAPGQGHGQSTVRCADVLRYVCMYVDMLCRCVRAYVGVSSGWARCCVALRACNCWVGGHGGCEAQSHLRVRYGRRFSTVVEKEGAAEAAVLESSDDEDNDGNDTHTRTHWAQRREASGVGRIRVRCTLGMFATAGLDG